MLFRTIVNSTKILFIYLLIQPPSPKIKIPQNSNLKANFQAGVDSIYDACVAKGSTPASKSLSDVVEGINNITTKGTIKTGTVSKSQIIHQSAKAYNSVSFDFSGSIPYGSMAISVSGFSGNRGTVSDCSLSGLAATVTIYNTSTSSQDNTAGVTLTYAYIEYS